MADAQQDVRIDFRPFWQQIQFIMSRAPQRAAVCGARGGKTALGLAVARDAAIMQEDYTAEEIAAGQPYNVTIGGRTFPWLESVIVQKLARTIPRELHVGRYNKTDHVLRVRGCKGLTEVRFMSVRNPESWYGEKIHFCWVDEFCTIKEAMYDEIQTRLTPRVGQRPGQLIMTGTPQGPNWAYQRIFRAWEEWRAMPEEERAVDPDHPGAHIGFFTWRTADNPYIPRAYIEQKRRSMPPRFFARTFLATWDTFAGMVYEEFARDLHVRRARDHRFVVPSGRRVGSGDRVVRLREAIAGVDWGFGAGHPGAILVLALDVDGRWWLVEESVAESLLLEGRSATEDSWVRRARVLRAKWDVRAFYCDSAEPRSIEVFRRARLPARAAQKDVLPGIQLVAGLLHADDERPPELLILDCCAVTIDEISCYHLQEGRELPVKIDDHTMDALRYALYTHLRRGGFDRELGYDAVA